LETQRKGPIDTLYNMTGSSRRFGQLLIVVWVVPEPSHHSAHLLWLLVPRGACLRAHRRVPLPSFYFRALLGPF